MGGKFADDVAGVQGFCRFVDADDQAGGIAVRAADDDNVRTVAVAQLVGGISQGGVIEAVALQGEGFPALDGFHIDTATVAALC